MISPLLLTTLNVQGTKKKPLSININLKTRASKDEKTNNTVLTKSLLFTKYLLVHKFVELPENNKNYRLFQHPELKMFFVRVYASTYSIYPLANSDFWIYKKESYNDFDLSENNFIFNLLKDNAYSNGTLN